MIRSRGNFYDYWLVLFNLYQIILFSFFLGFFQSREYLLNPFWVFLGSFILTCPLLVHQNYKNVANLITLFRVYLFSIGYFLFVNSSIPPLFVIGIYLCSFLLDGLDGFIARKMGGTSFGELFDMESDNWFLTTIVMSIFFLEGNYLFIAIIPLNRAVFVLLKRILDVRVSQASFSNSVSKSIKRWLAKVYFVLVVIGLLSSFYLHKDKAYLLAFCSFLSMWSFRPEYLILYKSIRSRLFNVWSYANKFK